MRRKKIRLIPIPHELVIDVRRRRRRRRPLFGCSGDDIGGHVAESAKVLLAGPLNLSSICCVLFYVVLLARLARLVRLARRVLLARLVLARRVLLARLARLVLARRVRPPC